MADCKIVNQKVIDAVTAIQNIAKEYENEGTTFENAFMNSISAMEGDAKDAMVELFNNSYKEFVTSLENGIPAMINGLASLLEGNRSNFENVDDQIAQSIRNGGK